MTFPIPQGFNVTRMLQGIRPDWVMLGVPWDAPGVCLIASKELASSGLEYRARQYDFRDWADFMRNFRPETTLTVNMKDFTLVAGPTYGECIMTLLKTWSPDDNVGPAAISS